ncbi:hypothetical protein NDU88_011611 [Pleurodeles waltl]|uniref:Uncharacterized protein n=1 Tax=Pleurodeles waltl TaxID=8319 RepID=A0AAV7S1Q0_PLEWA|nr:hypothetical protein NDU88_011611 [Pleurodeles waltl]
MCRDPGAVLVIVAAAVEERHPLYGAAKTAAVAASKFKGPSRPSLVGIQPVIRARAALLRGGSSICGVFNTRRFLNCRLCRHSNLRSEANSASVLGITSGSSPQSL